MKYTGTMYLYRPWTATHLRDVMAGTPNPSEVPTTLFGAHMLELVQRRHPTTAEIKRLMVTKTVYKDLQSVTDDRVRLSKIFRIHSDLTPPVDPTDDSPYIQHFLVESLHSNKKRQETCHETLHYT